MALTEEQLKTLPTDPSLTQAFAGKDVPSGLRRNVAIPVVYSLTPAFPSASGITPRSAIPWPGHA